MEFGFKAAGETDSFSFERVAGWYLIHLCNPQFFIMAILRLRSRHLMGYKEKSTSKKLAYRQASSAKLRISYSKGRPQNEEIVRN
jgi:hypothetical protein